MSILEPIFLLMLTIQLFHSLEELSTGFHEKFPLFKMKFHTFLTFEILFLSFWIGIYLIIDFQYRYQFMALFNLLMFANGIWHLTWCGIVKKYVPGVATAPMFVIAFLMFYFEVLF